MTKANMLEYIGIGVSDCDSRWSVFTISFCLDHMEHIVLMCVLFLCVHCLILFHYLIGCLIGYTLFLQFGTCFTTVVSLCGSRRCFGSWFTITLVTGWFLILPSISRERQLIGFGNCDRWGSVV